MKTKKKILFIGGGITLFFVFVLIVVALIFFLDKPLVKNILQSYVSKKYGMKLAIGKLDYDLFPLRIEALSVEVSQKSENQDMEVTLDRISIKGSLRKALKKEKPFLDLVEVENIVVHTDQKTAAKSDFKLNLPLLFDPLNFAAETRIKNVSYSLYSPSQAVSLSSSNLNVSMTGGKGEHSFDFTKARVDYQNSSAGTSFKCGLDAKGTTAFSNISVLEGDFSFSQLEASLSGKKAAFDSLDLAVRGEYAQEKNVVSFSRFGVKIPSLLEASGSGRVDLAQDGALSVNSDIFVQDIEKSLNILDPFLPQKIEGLSLKGQAEIRGEGSIFSTTEGKNADFSGTIKLLPARMIYKIPGLTFDSSISGEIKAVGSISNMEFSGLIRLDRGALSRENIKIRGLSLQLPFSGSRMAVKSGLFKGAMESFIFTSADRSAAVEAVDFEGRGRFDPGSMNILLNSLDVRALSMPTLHIEAKAGFKPGSEKQAKLQTSEFDAVQLRSLLSSFFPEQLTDWKFGGSGSLDLEVQLPPYKENKIWTFHGNLNLSEVLFQDPAFSLAGEALRPAISWKGEYDTKLEEVGFSLSFSLDHGESLWKEMYVSWSENQIQGDVSGVVRVPQKEAEIHSFNVHFLPYGNTSVTGIVKLEETYSLDFKGSAVLSLEAFNSGFLGLQPRWQEGYFMKGEAYSEFLLTAKDKTFKTSGELFIKEGTLENQTSNLTVQGIEARIPFDIATGGEEGLEEQAVSSEKGYFLAQMLETSYFRMQPFQLDISSLKNKFLIEPFSITLFGGTAAFGKSVFFVDPDRFDFNGIFSLKLDGLDISQFPIESNQFKFEGTMKANFPQVDLAPNLISTQGVGEVDIFEGKAFLENIKIFSPFSNSRTISLDIIFNDFNLEKMTDSVPFGRVTGILKGEIKGLAISYGQPESFALHLESVRRKGVPQQFSLKAVDDLTVLSSGEKSGFSALSGIARLAPSFPYGTIGIMSTLENDMFTLRGTFRKDGTEYLVRKSWLTGINVINRKPDNKISFKDMINRLKSIGKSGELK
ncbi:MAG: AsmA family protein [Candidatus Aminicenantes bacterium]|nr:AsmA family protein [Candidatus Aminicenantes bacterium]